MTLPANHPDIAQVLEKQSMLYQATDRTEKVEPILRQVMDIYTEAHGKDHPAVAQSGNNLGEYYLNKGRFDDAKPLFEASLAAREKSLGPDHPPWPNP